MSDLWTIHLDPDKFTEEDYFSVASTLAKLRELDVLRPAPNYPNMLSWAFVFAVFMLLAWIWVMTG